MAVISVGITRDGRGGSVDRKGQKSFEVVYRVITDSATDSALDAIDGAWKSTLPKKNTALQSDATGLTARTFRIRQGELPTIWLITVTYSAAQDEDPDTQDTGDPTGHPAALRFSTIATEEPIEKDETGEPLLNSAGQQFDPLPTRTVYRQQIDIEKDERNHDPNLAAGLTGKLNAAPFMGHGAETVRLVGSSSNTRYFRDPETGVEFDYWHVNYTLITGQEAFKEILDTGWMIKTADGKFLLNVQDNDKEPVRQKVLLDGLGAKAAFGQHHFIKFRLDDEEGFEALNIP